MVACLNSSTIIKQLRIKRGDPFLNTFKFTNPDGSDKDWTGATGKSQIRTVKDKTLVDSWAVTFDTEGQVNLFLTDEQTALFPLEILESDLEIVFDGSKLTYVYMRIFVEADVTY